MSNGSSGMATNTGKSNLGSNNQNLGDYMRYSGGDEGFAHHHIPFNGIVNNSNQSVISKISEPTRGEVAGGGSGADNAIKRLLREGMESADFVHLLCTRLN